MVVVVVLLNALAMLVIKLDLVHQPLALPADLAQVGARQRVALRPIQKPILHVFATRLLVAAPVPPVFFARFFLRPRLAMRDRRFGQNPRVATVVLEMKFRLPPARQKLLADAKVKVEPSEKVAVLA